MVRLNLILMVVLCAAVVGAALHLSMSGGERGDAQAYREELLRRLGDTDPDIAREASAEIRLAGLEMVPLLTEASAARDRILARRADALLAELTGGEPQPEPARGAPEAPPREEKPALLVRLEIDLPEEVVVQGEPARFYIRWHNDGTLPVQVVRERLGGMVTWARFGAFEIVDADGNAVLAAGDPWRKLFPDEKFGVERVSVGPGESVAFYAGQGSGSAEVSLELDPGTYTVRFVYDAGEESDYRRLVASEHLEAAALPAGRIISNEVSLTIVAVR